MIRFVCARYREFRGQSRAVNCAEYNFRKHNFHNDHQNSCGKSAINSIRKTWTKRALDVKYTCPFYFYIAYDDDGFFIVPGLGIKHHCYHNPLSILDNHDTFENNRHVSEGNEKMVADMGRGKLSPTQIQTAIFQSSGNL